MKFLTYVAFAFCYLMFILIQRETESEQLEDLEQTDEEEVAVFDLALKELRHGEYNLVCIIYDEGTLLIDSIKCWVCRSDSDPKCADPFDNSTVPITDCKQEPYLGHVPNVRPAMCRKIRQKVNGEWRYFRSCAYLGEPGIEGDERFCLMRTGSYNIFMEYCTCISKDGCNLAVNVNAEFGLIVGTLAILVMYSR